MNILNEANLLKKMAILVASLGLSWAIAPGAIAQLNPRPSIFNEPPYNRVAPRPEPRRGRQGHPPKPRPPIAPRSTNGAPSQTRFGGTQPVSPAGDRSRPKPLGGRQGHPPKPRPPRGISGGTQPVSLAGDRSRRHQAPQVSDPRTPRPTNRVPSAPRDRVYEAPNSPSNGTTPPPPGSLNAPLRVPSPGSP